MKILETAAVAALALVLSHAALAQTPVTLLDLGTTAPAPGPFDVSQLGAVGNMTFPDTLNYYTDNQTDHGAGEPGQTFITGTNSGGYQLTSLSLQSAGLDSGGGSPGGAINYLLHIYSVSGGNATLLATYISASPVSYVDGDWLQWSGLSVALSPATTYAYSFGKAVAGGGWDAMGVAGGNPYAGGEIGLIPTSGGLITFGSSHGFDAIFDAGLSLAGPPTAPVVTNSPVTGIQANVATLNGRIVLTGGALPVVTLYYGTSDGGTNAFAWANSVGLGQQSGSFAATVSGLATNTTYFYTAKAVNSAGTAWAAPSQSFTTLAANPVVTLVSMLTYHNDNTRDGANTNETFLTPGNVNVGSFGRLFSYAVDGHVYAQPLVMTNLNIPGQGVHNVVFAATEHDSVYAFDADSNAGSNGGLLWQTNLGVSAVMPNSDFGNRYGPYHDLTPEMGITGTPVIDPVSGTLYVDAFTHEGTNYYHRIHALNITNGNERSFSPVLVAVTISGGGVDSSGGKLAFNAEQSFNRCAMTLAGGILYVTYTGYADTDPYHGWILGYNPANLQLLTNYVFNTSPNSTIAVWGPNAGECGIWMGGNGLSVDANTNLYFEVGNGPFNANTNGTEYGDSFVRLSTSSKLAVADYFTPFNQASLSSADSDVGSGGPLLLPSAVGSSAHTNLIVGCGKEGKIYLVDRDNMGHYNVANDNAIVQEIPGAVGGTWSSPAYFNHFIYYHGNGDVLKAFSINNAAIGTTPASQSTTSYGFPGCTPAVSANGNNNGIVWDIQADAYGSGGPSILHAYNATNVAQELYNSSQNLTRDNPGGAVKMTVPTIVNGKVYVGAKFALSVYGGSLFLATPAISPNGSIFTNSITVTLSDATLGATIYYTLNGTAPTTNSTLYSGPFVITNSVQVQAIATRPGSVNSGVASASFVNSSSLGSGTGLSGAYYSNHNSTNPFTGSPTLVRTDATVNFNWGTGSPDPTISTDNFTVLWSGSVQPQYNETYTFYATADDGVRLWINGQELVNGWVDEGATTYQGSIALNAQQLYTITMEYYEHTGGAVAQLAWSSPSTAQAILPQTQLYPYTNPPPGVVLTAPASGSTYTASASVSLAATAAAQYNSLNNVAFYANGLFLGSISNLPYALTATGLAAGSYALTAVATDGSGLSSTSAPVNITVNAGSGLPYGLTSRTTVPAFYNMPQTGNGSLPALLSQTGVFANTTNMLTAPGLIPYVPNVALWSDGAAKTRWMALPFNGGLDTAAQQIGFATNGEWSFPTGTLFVKHFGLVTDETNTNAPLRRLETRLLVRDPNGAVYGVTYKWRPDNSDADLLSGSLNENILITNATGVRTQTWYYPSPSDCLTCHTPAANYVLGLKTRQLNGNFTYPASGVTDNQLRAFNHLGLFNPAIDEAQIPGYSQLVALTNLTASLTNRFRSYIDANCAQCHRPGGTGPTFDARYDTLLASQNIINGSVLGNLGYDNAHVVTPQDVWRSVLYDRMNTLDGTIKMPPLARNLIDSNAVAVVAAFINGLSGTPALPPPTLAPNGGTFNGSVSIAMQDPNLSATIHYTLDGSLPTALSSVYSGPVVLTSNAVVNANAFEAGFNNSVAASGVFTILPALFFNSAGAFSNSVFLVQLSGAPLQSYVFQASTDLVHWVSISTNVPPVNPFYLTDPNATNFPRRFYRALQGP